MLIVGKDFFSRPVEKKIPHYLMTSSNRMIFTQVVLSTFVLVRNRKIVLLPPVQVLILLGITKCTLGFGASNLMIANFQTDVIYLLYNSYLYNEINYLSVS